MGKHRNRKYRKSRRSRFWSFLLTFFLLSSLLLGIVYLDRLGNRKLTGRATVIDGDSLVMDGQRLRLIGIDAPELRQTCRLNTTDWNCGRQAKTKLIELIKPDLECEDRGEDRYGRLLVICRSNGFEINAEMVSTGWAVDYGGYSSEQQKAKKASLGIWKGSFTRPQEWRRAKKEENFDVEAMGALHSIWEALKRWFTELFR